MKVESAMCSQVFTCTPSDSLNRAAQIMWEKDCGCLPVVDDDGWPIGMITDRDICMAAYTQGISLHEGNVASAMSQPVVSCQTRDSVANVERLMKDRQIRRIPVLDEFGTLAGIITLGDLARCAEDRSLRESVSPPEITDTMVGICTPSHQRQPRANIFQAM
jgi:CBS domain-containing protein